MKTRILVGFGISAIAVCAVLLLTGSALSQGSGAPTTIHVVERAENDVVTDTGAEGDSVGDILTFANSLYDENNDSQVGTDQGYCVRTVVGAAWECFWTIFLDDGQITVQGPFYDDGSDSVFAITGGTAAYANAGGQMTLHFRNDTGTEFDFIYEVYVNSGM